MLCSHRRTLLDSGADLTSSIVDLDLLQPRRTRYRPTSTGRTDLFLDHAFTGAGRGACSSITGDLTQPTTFISGSDSALVFVARIMHQIAVQHGGTQAALVFSKIHMLVLARERRIEASHISRIATDAVASQKHVREGKGREEGYEAYEASRRRRAEHSASASVKSPSLRLCSQPQNHYLFWTDLKRRLTSVGPAGARHVKHAPRCLEVSRGLVLSPPSIHRRILPRLRGGNNDL